MNLGRFIHTLLLENETVTIPGFGAFISHYKPAEISETGEIIPPSKEISFNQQIRNNDGLLVGFVAEVESVSHFDALRLIEKERENIIYHLDKGENVTLEETGLLFINEEQKIQFKSLIEENLLLDSFGLGPVLPGEEPQITEEDKFNIQNEIEENRQSEEPAIKFSTDESRSGFEPAKAEKNNISNKNQPGESILKNEINIEETPVEKESETGQKTKIAKNIPKKEPEEKKKIGWLWAALIIVLLVVAGIFVAKNNHNGKKSNPDLSKVPETKEIPLNKNEETLNTPLINDSLQTTLRDSVQDTKTERQATEVPDENSKRFYLVGGSFKAEENALKFIEQFNTEGYEPFYMGKIGNYYFVGIGRYDTKKKAVEARNLYFEKNPGSGSWVYEKKVE